MTRTTLVYSILLLAAASALTIAAVTMAPAITSAGGESGSEILDPRDFSTHVDNPLFPLSTLGPKVFEGEETDPDTGELVLTRFTSTVLPRSHVVAGVKVLVLEEKAYENGEIVERALDFFAQHRDGTVYYFGEKVDNYEDGKVVNHDGSWLAGKGPNQPGVIMPPHPFLGQVIKQELAPGIAEDEARVVALNESVAVPAGAFSGCLKTEDYNPLVTPLVIEFKFYCPGVGLVREEMPDGYMHLTSHTTVAAGPNATALAEVAVPADNDAAPAEVAVGEDPVSSVTADAEEDDDASNDNGDPDDGDEQADAGKLDDGEDLLGQASITIGEAIAAAQSAASGPVGEIDLEHHEGKLVFNIDIGDKDVKVDALTGIVLSIDADD